MKKIFIFCLFLLSTSALQAGEQLVRGVVDAVDAESRQLVVNGLRYTIQHGKTQMTADGHGIDLGLLKPGDKIQFFVNRGMVRRIMLKTSNALEQ